MIRLAPRARLADHDDLDRVLGVTGRIPDPADLHALADDAVAQVRRWLAESRDHEADFAARQLAGALKEPGGLDFIVRFVDHVVRPEDPAIAARALRELAGRAPGFLPPTLRAVLGVGGRAAPLVPRIAVPTARRVLRHMFSHLIVDARDRQLGKDIAALRDEHTRLNINLLGEAILGQGEADRRLMPPRHCWVTDPPAAPGRWPGVVVGWRTVDGRWEGRVVVVVGRGPGAGVLDLWLGEHQLAPA